MYVRSRAVAQQHRGADRQDHQRGEQRGDREDVHSRVERYAWTEGAATAPGGGASAMATPVAAGAGPPVRISGASQHDEALRVRSPWHARCISSSDAALLNRSRGCPGRRRRPLRRHRRRGLDAPASEGRASPTWPRRTRRAPSLRGSRRGPTSRPAASSRSRTRRTARRAERSTAPTGSWGRRRPPGVCRAVASRSRESTRR